MSGYEKCVVFQVKLAINANHLDCTFGGGFCFNLLEVWNKTLTMAHELHEEMSENTDIENENRIINGCKSNGDVGYSLAFTELTFNGNDTE